MTENSIDKGQHKDEDLKVEVPMEVVVGNDVAGEEGSKPAEKAKQEQKKPVQSKDSVAEKKGNDTVNISGVLGNKTIEDVINQEAKEEQDTSSPFSLSRTLGGVIIARAFQSQIWLVMLICAFLIIYITNRYVCQKKQVEIAKIESKMVEARYKATVCSSILTEKSRESNIMHLLNAYGDSTLTVPKDPPYLIRVPND